MSANKTLIILVDYGLLCMFISIYYFERRKADYIQMKLVNGKSRYVSDV